MKYDKIIKYTRLFASALDKESFEKAMHGLMEKNLIEYKSRLGIFEFKNNIGSDVESAILDHIIKKLANIDICDSVNSIISLLSLIMS